jgi:hypothetical protein
VLVLVQQREQTTPGYACPAVGTDGALPRASRYNLAHCASEGEHAAVTDI